MSKLQIFGNRMLRDKLEHRCRPLRLHFRTSSPRRTDDTWAVIDDEIYKVDEISASTGAARGRLVELRPLKTDDVDLDLPWGLVGVYVKGRLQSHARHIDLTRATGKAILLSNKFLIVYHREWFVK